MQLILKSVHCSCWIITCTLLSEYLLFNQWDKSHIQLKIFLMLLYTRIISICSNKWTYNFEYFNIGTSSVNLLSWSWYWGTRTRDGVNCEDSWASFPCLNSGFATAIIANFTLALGRTGLSLPYLYKTTCLTRNTEHRLPI